jgi:hypothetical protein
MSLLELGYEVERQHYAQHEFSQQLDRKFEVASRVSFSTGDDLIVSDTYTSGFSDVTSISAGGELVFLGEPYDLNRAELIMNRSNPLRAGYEVRLTRVDFAFDGDDPVPFFDYDGWEGSAEYRQPMGMNRWLTLDYVGRRYDHFIANCPEAGPEACGDDPSTPFRRESGDALGLGLRGRLSGGLPYFLKVGYSRYELDGDIPAFLNATVLQGEIALPVGPRTAMRVALTRRPFPSTYATYYMTNFASVTAERAWRLSRLGIEATYSYNAYGGPLLDPITGEPATSCGLDIRRDRIVGAGSFLDWLLHPRLSLRVSVDHQTRSSSCGSGDYDVTEAFTGIRFGWF